MHTDIAPMLILLTHFLIGFGSGMVNFEVNFPELSDADVLVEPGMKQAVKVSATAITRFVAPLSETDVKKLIDSQGNANYEKHDLGASGVFVSWRAHRNSFGAGEIVKESPEMNTEEMNYYIRRFLAEARKL